jgi:hypothetical protein
MMLEDMVTKIDGIVVGPATNLQSGIDLARLRTY